MANIRGFGTLVCCSVCQNTVLLITIDLTYFLRSEEVPDLIVKMKMSRSCVSAGVELGTPGPEASLKQASVCIQETACFRTAALHSSALCFAPPKQEQAPC